MKFDTMKEFMNRLTEWKIPGNGVSVYYQGEEVFSYASGYADVERNVSMTTDHLLNIYSCSKVVTVVAALQLYEKGFFQLDAPVYSILPEYREMYVQTEEGVERTKRDMTIRQLFTIAVGFASYIT